MEGGSLDERPEEQEGLPRGHEHPHKRAQRIAEIKRQIREGTYRPPLLAVADELLNGGHLSFDHDDE